MIPNKEKKRKPNRKTCPEAPAYFFRMIQEVTDRVKVRFPLSSPSIFSPEQPHISHWTTLSGRISTRAFR